MKIPLNTNSLKGMVLHIVAILLILTTMILIFFYIYLPKETNHGETITVPDLYKSSVNDLEELLIDRDLTYEVSDSVYDSSYPPLTILRQYPSANSKVKQGRKIFISVNRKNAPQIELPDLLDGKSITHVQAVLNNLDIKINKIIAKQHPYAGLVLEIQYQGEAMVVGQSVPQGSSVDIVVGNGGNDDTTEMPDFFFMPWDEAEFVIKEGFLNLEPIRIAEGVDTTDAELFVINQSPLPTTEIQIGQYITITLSTELDSTYYSIRMDTVATVPDSLQAPMEEMEIPND